MPSPMDHIETANEVIKKECVKQLCLAFIAYEKAFDSGEIEATVSAILQQDAG